MMSTFLFIFVVGTSTGGGTEIITSKSSTDTITPSDSSTLLYIVIGVVIAVVLVLCAVMIAMVAYIIYEKKRYDLLLSFFKISYVLQSNKIIKISN